MLDSLNVKILKPMEWLIVSKLSVGKNVGSVIVFLFFACSLASLVNGHGALTHPPSKNGGNLSVTSWNPADHFALASYGIIDKAFFDGDHSITPWKRAGEFDFHLARDVVPGHPQTLHPCGCNAGDIAHCAGVGVATGFGETTSGATITPPEWAKGSSQDVGWNAWVNHGGGDIFMLCKKTDFDACRTDYLPISLHTITEQAREDYLSCVWGCFESQTLEFDDTAFQKLQYQDDKCSYVSINAIEKVGKDFNSFRFTPIPDSLQVTNGGEGVCTWENVEDFSNDNVRNKFIESFGTDDVCDWGKDNHSPKDWHVIDTVKIPTDISNGEYLLSWRWDTYTADQMWTSCADVTIVTTSNNPSSIEEDCKNSPPTTNSPITTAPPPTPSPVATTLPPTASPVATTLPPTTSPVATTSTPTIEVDPVCTPGYSGLLPYESCTKYFRCDNGIVVQGTLLNCPGGTLFDIDNQYCNWESQVTCEDDNPDGCWSNNYKDCNHPDFQTENDSPTSIWLPQGKQHFCTALWAKCNYNNQDCCKPAICYGDSTYGQCRPSS